MRPDTVAWRASIASFLEASAEKPGNVTPTKGFSDLTYSDYLIASSLIQRPIFVAARSGTMVKSGGDFSEVRLGRHVLHAVDCMYQFLGTRNPNFGIILMYIPLAIAAGHMREPGELRVNLHRVISNATPQDTVDIYRAMRQIEPGGIVNPKNIPAKDSKMLTEFDINKRGVLNSIKEEGITPLDIFNYSSHYDTLASEWVSNYSVCFTYLDVFKKNANTFGLSEAIVYTYLQILSRLPDTYIARKLGDKEAAEVSRRAESLLKTYPKGLSEFDRYLRDRDNARNPGTTADLIATILFLWLLEK